MLFQHLNRWINWKHQIRNILYITSASRRYLWILDLYSGISKNISLSWRFLNCLLGIFRTRDLSMLMGESTTFPIFLDVLETSSTLLIFVGTVAIFLMLTFSLLSNLFCSFKLQCSFSLSCLSSYTLNASNWATGTVKAHFFRVCKLVFSLLHLNSAAFWIDI